MFEWYVNISSIVQLVFGPPWLRVLFPRRSHINVPGPNTVGGIACFDQICSEAYTWACLWERRGWLMGGRCFLCTFRRLLPPAATGAYIVQNKSLKQVSSSSSPVYYRIRWYNIIFTPLDRIEILLEHLFNTSIVSSYISWHILLVEMVVRTKHECTFNTHSIAQPMCCNFIPSAVEVKNSYSSTRSTQLWNYLLSDNFDCVGSQAVGYFH